MKHSRFARLCSLGVAAAALAAFGLTASAHAAEQLKLRLSWAPFGMHAAFHLAKHSGLYAKEGLNLEIEDGKGSALTVNVVGGSSDPELVGEASVATMATLAGKGVPLRSVMLMLPGNDLGVLVPADTGAKTVKDLETKGISIVYTPGSLEGPFMDVFLKNGGSSRDKIQLIGVDASAKISTYLAGKGGSVVTSTPFIEPVLRKQKPSNVIKFADYNLPLPSLGIIATDETIAKKAAALRILVQVTSKTWADIFANADTRKKAVEAIIAERPNLKLDPWLLDVQIDEYKPLFFSENAKGKPIGWQAEADWAAAVKVMKEAGLLDAKYKPSDFYTNKFIDGSAS